MGTTRKLADGLGAFSAGDGGAFSDANKVKY